MNRISGAILCCHLVSSNIVFGRRLRCCGAPLLRSARRLLPSSHCHMAAFQRCTGKPERDGDTQRDMVRPGKLFYIIPRHNRANPNVRVHTLQQGGECVFSTFTFSRDFPAYRFNGGGGLLLVSGSQSWRSQPCRAIIIMNSGGATLHPDARRNKHGVLSACCTHARDSSTDGPSSKNKEIGIVGWFQFPWNLAVGPVQVRVCVCGRVSVSVCLCFLVFVVNFLSLFLVVRNIIWKLPHK